VLNKYIPTEEIKKLENVMPHNLKDLLCPQSLSGSQRTTQATV